MKILLGLAAAAASLIGPPPPPHWTDAQIRQLIAWLQAAAADGLTGAPASTEPLRPFPGTTDRVTLDVSATRAAERLLADHIAGCCNASLRSSWHIANGLEQIDRAAAVAAAVHDDDLDALFDRARPSHPYYLALRAAYARERDPARRATLAANLDRWRWMPRDLGDAYLLVNAAAFEASLWRDGALAGRWAIVVGKTKSPTPVFTARVTGVTINPWWDLPPAIAREGVADLFARNPREADRLGYVRSGGRYRQRPGAGNALGRMKLVMPNPYNVYLHDTPARSLFGRDVRAFSHGCVRVGDALGLASSLLGAGWPRDRLEEAVRSGPTRTIRLASPITVYVTYFTAEPDGLGGVRYFPDIYARDRGAKALTSDGRCHN